MDIKCTNLTSGINTSAGTTSTSSSISPAPNKLILATVSSYRNDSTNPASPTLSGNGLTWVVIDTALFDSTSTSRRRMTLYRAMKIAPTVGTVLMDFGSDTQSQVAWCIDQISGIDTSGTNGSGAIVQSVPKTDGINGAISISLSSFSNIGNATYGSFGCAGDTATAGSGFTIYGQGGSIIDSIVSATEFRNDNSTAVNLSWSDGTQISGGVAIELKLGKEPTLINNYQFASASSENTGILSVGEKIR